MSLLSKPNAALAAAVVSGVALATLLAHVLPCPWPLKSRSKGVYVLAVFLTIKPGTLALFKERWAAVAKSANSSAEPGCLSYELSVNPDDDCDLLIYERYVTKEDLTGPHRVTAAFKAFGKWLNEESNILVAKSNKSYVETNVGHVRVFRSRRARRTARRRLGARRHRHFLRARSTRCRTTPRAAPSPRPPASRRRVPPPAQMLRG